MKVEKKCPICGVTYFVLASVLKNSPINFCSMACRKIDTKRRNGPLTAEELRNRLNYDPQTGVFTYKKNYGVVPGKKSGWVDELGYVHVRVGKLYLAHRLAWLYVYGKWPEGYIDHINGDPGDNRLSNLRECSQSQNMHNSKIMHKLSSVRKGVCFDPKRKLFKAYITLNSRQKFLGRFPTKEEAIAARLEAEKQYHGEFARAA